MLVKTYSLALFGKEKNKMTMNAIRLIAEQWNFSYSSDGGIT